MKKISRLKKAGTLMLSVLLAMAAVTTVTAAEEEQTVAKMGRLVIQGTAKAPKDEAVFTVYPVATFDAEKLGDSENYIYTNIKVSKEFETLVEAEEYEGVKGWEAISRYATNGTANVPGSRIAAFAAKLEASLSKPEPAGEYVIGKAALELPYGYYLAVETAPGTDEVSLRSSPILVAIPGTGGNGSVTVTVKSSGADIDKKIVDDGNSVSYNDAAVGDKVSYRVSSDIPLYGAEVSNGAITYKIVDSLSKGLTYNDDLKLYLVTGDKTIPLYSSADKTSVFADEILNTASDGERTAITIDLSGKMGTVVEGTAIRYYPQDGTTQIVAEYSADLNEYAVMGNVGNENRVTLTYDADHTTERLVKTYSTSLKVIKKEKAADGATNEKLLAGAKFKIQKEVTGDNGEKSYVDLTQTDGSIYELETGDNGESVFNGLDEGTYKLIETKAPVGYSLDATERIFTLTLKEDNASVSWEGLGAADNMTIEAVPDAEGTFQSTIYNVKGITLPGTGGSGTAMFKIVGAGLMILACIMLLVYYKKKGKTD